MKKTILIIAGVVLLLTFGAAFVSAYAFTQFTKNKNLTNLALGSSGDGQITALTSSTLAYLVLDDGSVNITRAGNDEDVFDKMALIEGDELEVTDGSIRLMYPDYGMSKVLAGTDLTLARSRKANAGAGIGVMLQMKAGEVWTRLDKLLGMEDDFAVEANDVIATVRGTGFGVISSAKGLSIKVAEHKVRVMPALEYDTADADNNFVDLTENNKLVFDATDIRSLSGQHEQKDWFARTMVREIAPMTSTDFKGDGYEFTGRELDMEELQAPQIPIGGFFWFLDPRFDLLMRQYLPPADYQEWLEARNWFLMHPEVFSGVMIQ